MKSYLQVFWPISLVLYIFLGVRETEKETKFPLRKKVSQQNLEEFAVILMKLSRKPKSAKIQL